MNFIEFSKMDDPQEAANRIKKAASAEQTPVSIDRETKTGEFKGSSGFYTTTLKSCSCRDYSLRKLPCKHMYRLAHECGEFYLQNVEADASKQIDPSTKITSKKREQSYQRCISLIETYPEEVQKELQSVLAKRYKNEAYVCSDFLLLLQPLSDGLLENKADYCEILKCMGKKATVDRLIAESFVFPDGVKRTVSARFEWAMQNAQAVCYIAWPDAACMVPSGDLEIANRKVYTFLNQRFEKEYVFYY